MTYHEVIWATAVLMLVMALSYAERPWLYDTMCKDGCCVSGGEIYRESELQQ